MSLPVSFPVFSSRSWRSCLSTECCCREWVSTQLGKQSTHSGLSLPRKRGRHQLVQPCAVPPWGGAALAKLLLPSSMYPNSFLFSPVQCWNFPLGRLSFYKVSLGGCLPRSTMSRFPPTQLRARGRFAGFCESCGPQQGLWPVTQCAGGQESSQVHRYMVLDPADPHRGIFVHGRMTIFSC